jgi:hypothetical protein
MADWVIRPATADDVEAVAEVRAVAMRADLERLGRYDEHRVRQRLRDGFVPAHTPIIETVPGFLPVTVPSPFPFPSPVRVVPWRVRGGGGRGGSIMSRCFASFASFAPFGRR